jgi:putative SOS response-associated peptidase YedK
VGEARPLEAALSADHGRWQPVLAGLWERWRDPTSGEVVRTFTVITTEPNELAAPIHNRMPAIIGPADYATWLGEEPAEKDELLALLMPFPAERMCIFDRRVGNPKDEDAGLVELLRFGSVDVTAIDIVDARPACAAEETIEERSVARRG